jgi:hypothetical protein
MTYWYHLAKAGDIAQVQRKLDEKIASINNREFSDEDFNSLGEPWCGTIIDGAVASRSISMLRYVLMLFRDVAVKKCIQNSYPLRYRDNFCNTPNSIHPIVSRCLFDPSFKKDCEIRKITTAFVQARYTTQEIDSTFDFLALDWLAFRTMNALFRSNMFN